MFNQLLYDRTFQLIPYFPATFRDSSLTTSSSFLISVFFIITHNYLPIEKTIHCTHTPPYHLCMVRLLFEYITSAKYNSLSIPVRNLLLSPKKTAEKHNTAISTLKAEVQVSHI